jgi:hypothetical protein
MFIRSDSPNFLYGVEHCHFISFLIAYRLDRTSYLKKATTVRKVWLTIKSITADRRNPLYFLLAAGNSNKRTIIIEG